MKELQLTVRAALPHLQQQEQQMSLRVLQLTVGVLMMGGPSLSLLGCSTARTILALSQQTGSDDQRLGGRADSPAGHITLQAL